MSRPAEQAERFAAAMQAARTALEEAQPEPAVAHLRAALAVRPDAAAATALGEVLLRLGRPEEAVAAWRDGLAQAKGEAGLSARLGTLLRRLGRAGEAVPVYRLAVGGAPEDAGLRLGMGLALLESGRADAAVSALLRARALDGRLAGVTAALGAALLARGDAAEAVPVLRAALAEQPGDEAAALALGRALLRLDRAAEAGAVLQAALALRPDAPALLALRARVLLAQRRPEAALAGLRRMLAQRPVPAEALLVSGLALRALGRPAEAVRALAVAGMPDAGADEAARQEARRALALARLSLGDHAGGWPDFTVPAVGAVPPAGARLRHPVWDGTAPLAGEHLLVYADGGVSDTVQFLRYVPMLAGLGARVRLLVPAALHPLAAAMPVPPGASVRVLAPDEPVGDGVTMRVALGALPGAFGTTLPTVPPVVPYLAAPAEALARVRDALGAAAGRRIGIAWRAAPLDGPGMTLPGLGLAELDSLLALLGRAAGGAVLHALGPLAPPDEAAAEAALLDRLPGLVELRHACADAAHLAAALACMDLVLAVDGSVLHLAGALGRPGWGLLGAVADWRWMQGQRRSPWYATLRLFRRTGEGPAGWAALEAELGAALARL